MLKLTVTPTLLDYSLFTLYSQQVFGGFPTSSVFSSEVCLLYLIFCFRNRPFSPVAFMASTQPGRTQAGILGSALGTDLPTQAVFTPPGFGQAQELSSTTNVEVSACS